MQAQACALIQIPQSSSAICSHLQVPPAHTSNFSQLETNLSESNCSTPAFGCCHRLSRTAIPQHLSAQKSTAVFKGQWLTHCPAASVEVAPLLAAAPVSGQGVPAQTGEELPEPQHQLHGAAHASNYKFAATQYAYQQQAKRMTPSTLSKTSVEYEMSLPTTKAAQCWPVRTTSFYDS